MKIGLGCVSWNQSEGLERLLKSCKDFDRKIVIDGRYYQRNDGPEFSGYDEICKKHNAELILKSNVPEYVKRNTYFEIANDLDCLIILDDDEYVSRWDRGEFEESLQARQNNTSLAYNLEFWENNQQYEIPRIFIHPTKCYYKDRHNMIWSGNTEILGRNTGPKINGIIIKHDKSFRASYRESYNRLYRQSHAFE
jgi:hypothetical protein